MVRPAWPEDYLDAHRRHWEDAETLYGLQRWANADHLYGLSAECGLKAVMVALGLPTDTRGRLEKPYRKHIDELWEEFLSCAQGRSAARYVTLLPDANPFQDWRANQRYVHRKYFTREHVDRHRSGLESIRQVVHEAEMDGKL